MIGWVIYKIYKLGFMLCLGRSGFFEALKNSFLGFESFEIVWQVFEFWILKILIYGICEVLKVVRFSFEVFCRWSEPFGTFEKVLDVL